MASLSLSSSPCCRPTATQQAALYDRAASAVHWTATFCDRNGPTCEQAGVLWAGFVKKAQFGAAMAYELAMKQAGDGAKPAP